MAKLPFRPALIFSNVIESEILQERQLRKEKGPKVPGEQEYRTPIRGRSRSISRSRCLLSAPFCPFYEKRYQERLSRKEAESPTCAGVRASY